MDTLSRTLQYAQRNKYVQESLDIIEEAIVKYGLDNVCVSFNGGKDCTAVLHLVHSAARKLSQNNDDPKLAAFYAELPNHFEEESKFVRETVKRYNLTLMHYPTKSKLKESLFQLKLDAPHIEAIFIGTRKDDLRPDSDIAAFAPTDEDWPKFMRVNPILNWSYAQVWMFIKELDLPYCDLYNQGYSSLGTRDDTKKNSSLLRLDDRGKPYYLPAWNLKKSNEERMSRSSSLGKSS